MGDQYVKPYSDFFVKYLLGSEENKELLLSFINAVLEDSAFNRITAVTIKNPFNLKTSVTDKESILDIKAEDEEGRHYDIEVQVGGDQTFKRRSLYYWAEMYTDQLSEGEEYEKLNPVICINLLNFNLLPDLDQIHSCFLLREEKNPDCVLTDHLILHFLELPKLKDEMQKSKLVHWLLFFKYEGKREDLMTILIKNDDDIRKAHERYKKFTHDDELRAQYRSRERWRRDRVSEIRAATQQGLEKGLHQKEDFSANKMIDDGMPDELIIKYTGIDPQRLKELRDNL